MLKYLTIKYDLCTGCRLCEMACAWHNEHSSNTELSKISVFSYYPGIDIAIFCAKCPDAPCVDSCKFDALSICEDGCINVDQKKCVGCGMCVRRCRSGCIRLHPKLKYPLICDHCGGNEPSCVKVCQTHALSFTPVFFDRRNFAKKKETIRDELLEKF